jgi:hypothetical protein
VVGCCNNNNNNNNEGRKLIIGGRTTETARAIYPAYMFRTIADRDEFRTSSTSTIGTRYNRLESDWKQKTAKQVTQTKEIQTRVTNTRDKRKSNPWILGAFID